MPVYLNQLDFVGDELPLRFVVGQLLDIGVKIVDSEGIVENITGRTYTAEIGPSGGDSIATFTVVDTDLPNGLFNYTLDTSSLEEGQYRWIAWENGSNFLWSGPVEIINPDTT